ncbi:MAG: hypothetical protein JWP96_339 [Polaromonas sp.]|jgi:hypothetical protein|nr:hypothetical protein [Polaromonas sp.]
MSIFQRTHYKSEFSQFLDDLKAKKPEIEPGQRAGRAIWWDKQLNRADQADYGEARVAQGAYVYGTSAHPNGS